LQRNNKIEPKQDLAAAPTLMKDGLNASAILRIAKSLTQIIPEFNANQFHKDGVRGIETLELKERVGHLIHVLHLHYRMPFKNLCKHLKNLPDVWDHGDIQDPKASFAAWPIIDYVATHGLEHPKEALALLEKLTPLFTAEFAVRPFIKQHPDVAYKQLLNWCEHDSEHVRRLASEGSRTRLPWGMRLPQFIKDPNPLEAILEKLNADESLYVRRSVANNLNDISKDNPDWVITLCKKWKEKKDSKTDWIIKHALRSLIKAGDSRAFPLLGYTKSAITKIKSITLNQTRIRLGDTLEFSFTIIGGKETQQVVIDYVIYFMKANGKLAPKVFKLKNVTIPEKTELALSKKHSFKNITTRTYYLGQHQIAIHINGKEAIRSSFDLS
jgi:3-methyladenine DNA glycosylase AlkC